MTPEIEAVVRAREALAAAPTSGRPIHPDDTKDLYDARRALDALLRHATSERAQLGELLVRAVEAHRARAGGDSGRSALGTFSVRWYAAERHWSAHLSALGSGVQGEGATLPDALRALLAKVEGA